MKRLEWSIREPDGINPSGSPIFKMTCRHCWHIWRLLHIKEIVSEEQLFLHPLRCDNCRKSDFYEPSKAKRTKGKSKGKDTPSLF